MTRETELGGTRLRAGEHVAMFYSAANRDPELLPRIDESQLDGPAVRLRSSLVHGVKHLPVRVRAA